MGLVTYLALSRIGIVWHKEQVLRYHIIFLDKKIIEQGEVDEIFVNPKHHLLKQMIKGVVNNGTFSSGLR